MSDKKMPVALYTGILQIGDLKMPVAVLDNGERVITLEGMENFMIWLETCSEGEARDFGEKIGKFIHMGEIPNEDSN